MPLRLIAFACTFWLIATGAQADHIVINKRFVVAKDDVRGFFFRTNNQQTVFDVRWSDWSTKYRCTDTYDRDRVLAASLNFVLELEKARDLDFKDFLAGQGFQDCDAF